MRTGLVCLPRLKLSSTLPSMTATARKSPCNVGPWFIQMSKPLRVVVRMFTINLFRFSPRRLKYSDIIHMHPLELQILIFTYLLTNQICFDYINKQVLKIRENPDS